MTEEQKRPLPLGQFIRTFGKVAAVGYVGGERYYWFTNEGGDVSMMPAFVVENEDER